MDLLEKINELIEKYESVNAELRELKAQSRVVWMDAANIPEFGDEKVLSLVLSGREGGKIKPSSIRKLCERGIISRTKVLDKWMFHIPTAIDEFRKYMEDEAGLYEVDVV